MGQHVRAGDLDIWTEQVGQGPDVLLIGGAGEQEAHQPFQEVPDEWNARVDAFWRQLEAGD